MNKVKTDNSNFTTKVLIRLNNIPKKNVTVLDCYHEYGKIWNEIKRQFKHNIKIVSIDKKPESNAVYKGDNIKYLKTIDLTKYDIIDLDAYGMPFFQLECIFKSNIKKAIIFYTCIFTVYGGLQRKLLYQLGYTKKND